MMGGGGDLVRLQVSRSSGSDGGGGDLVRLQVSRSSGSYWGGEGI